MLVFLAVFVVITLPLELLERNGAISKEWFGALRPLGHLFGWFAAIYLAFRLSGSDARRILLRRAVPLPIIAPLLVASVGMGIVIVQAATWIPTPEPTGVEEPLPGIEIAGRLFGRLIVAPFAEEVFFRGLLLYGFVRRYGETRAILATALLFAVSHVNPWLAIMALPGGLAYAWLALRTGTLAPTILSHVVINLVPIVFSGYLSHAAIEESEVYSPLQLALGIAGTVIGSAMVWRRVQSIHGKQGGARAG